MQRQRTNEERMRTGSGGSSLLAGLMIGGLVGAGAMLLLAPQAGRQTREELGAGARDLKDRTTDTVRGAVSTARAKAEDVVSGVREKASDLQAQGRDMAIDQLDRVASVAQSKKRSLQSSRGNSGSEA